MSQQRRSVNLKRKLSWDPNSRPPRTAPGRSTSIEERKQTNRNTQPFSSHEKTAMQAKFEQLALTKTTSQGMNNTQNKFKSPNYKSPFNIEESQLTTLIDNNDPQSMPQDDPNFQMDQNDYVRFEEPSSNPYDAVRDFVNKPTTTVR